MPDKILNGRIQTKIDTFQNWQASKQPLLEGELAIDSTNHELRYGDGENTFQNSKVLGVTVDDKLDGNSTNPVQNKVVNSALGGKSDKGHPHTTSDITDFPTSMPASDVQTWAKQANKPTYNATEVGAIPTSAKGTKNGVAELDANGRVPTAQLPSYVDDVIEGYLSSGIFYNEVGHTTQIAGETGKIYVDIPTNVTYRWSGSGYTEISKSLALGETSSTAYYGDKGKTAYDHSQKAHAPSDAEKNVIVGIQTNGIDVAADTSRKVNIKVPTKTSDLVNDSNFKTTDNNTTYDLAANTSAANGNVKLNLTDSNKGTDSVTIKGTGATSVTTDSTGAIVVNSTDTNTTYVDATTTQHGLMSTADKSKLSGIANGAEVNVINSVKVNGTALTPSSKAVNVSITGSGATKVNTDASGNITISSTDTNTDTNTTYDLAATKSSANGSAQIQLTGNDKTTDSVTIKGTGATQVTTDSSGNIIVNSTDNNTNTTYDLAASTSSTNGNVKVNLIGSNSATDSVSIKGSGATSVTTDSTGVITISSTDNNTTYSAASSSLGLVKSGGDVTISNGVISVNDNSHLHSIIDVAGLEAALNGKLPITGGTLTGDLRLKGDNGENYGRRIRFGDDDYVYLLENPDDYLIIHAENGINLTTNASGAKDVTINGQKIPLTARKTATKVVGTTKLGHTTSDCDYLCDGTADQTEIQSAINSLPASGGKVVLLEGTYNISASINVNKPNVTIEGMGRGSTRLIYSGSSFGCLNVTGDRFEIKNLSIERSGSDIANLAIYINGSSSTYGLVDNVYMNHFSYGINITQSDTSGKLNTFHTVRNCVAIDCQIGFHINACENIVQSCYAISCTGGYINIEGSRNVIYHNTIRNFVTGGWTNSMYSIKVNSGATYNMIHDNKIFGKDYTNDGGTTNTFVDNRYN